MHDSTLANCINIAWNARTTKQALAPNCDKLLLEKNSAMITLNAFV